MSLPLVKGDVGAILPDILCCAINIISETHVVETPVFYYEIFSSLKIFTYRTYLCLLELHSLNCTFTQNNYGNVSDVLILNYIPSQNTIPLF